MAQRPVPSACVRRARCDARGEQPRRAAESCPSPVCRSTGGTSPRRHAPRAAPRAANARRPTPRRQLTGSDERARLGGPLSPYACGDPKKCSPTRLTKPSQPASASSRACIEAPFPGGVELQAAQPRACKSAEFGLARLGSAVQTTPHRTRRLWMAGVSNHCNALKAARAFRCGSPPGSVSRPSPSGCRTAAWCPPAQ